MTEIKIHRANKKFVYYKKDIQEMFNESFDNALRLIGRPGETVLKIEGVYRFIMLDELRRNLGIKLYVNEKQYRGIKDFYAKSRHLISAKIEHVNLGKHLTQRSLEQ